MRSLPILIVVAVLAIGACGAEEPAPTGPADGTVKEADEPETAVEFVAAGRGQVVVLLLGMEGCAKTTEASRYLAKYAPDAPDDVRIARLDVPPPNDAVLGVEDWQSPYFYAVDDDRKVAETLDFFYYPTLYLLDREGEVRYAGGCEPAKLVAMIDDVRSEKPGDEKTVFTPPLPAVGTPAPAFAAKDLDGEDVSLDTLREDGAVFLLFTSMGCPFSAKAVDGLGDLADEAEDVRATFVAIEQAGDAAAIGTFYADRFLPGPAVHDADGSICQKFGVEPAPFFFLVGKDGKIAARGPYTKAAALAALGLDATGSPATGGG